MTPMNASNVNWCKSYVSKKGFQEHYTDCTQTSQWRGIVHALYHFSFLPNANLNEPKGRKLTQMFQQLVFNFLFVKFAGKLRHNS